MKSIIRTKKHKSIANLKSRETHTFRTRPTPNANPEKLKLNKLLFGKISYSQECELQLSDYSKNQKIRSDAVIAIEYLLTASPEFFEQGSKNERNARLKKWCEAQIEFLRNKHGAENILCAYLHLDEKTPHIEAFILPIDPKGKLNCKHFLGGAKKLSDLQTDYAKWNEGFGLSRGIKGSTATHTKVDQFYSMISEKSEISNQALIDSIKVDKPTVSDMLKLDEFVKAQQQKIVTEVTRLFKGTIYENKLLPQAKKIIADSERKEKEVAKMKYQHQKELDKLKDQLTNQLTLIGSVQAMEIENDDLRKQVIFLLKENESLKKKFVANTKKELTK